MHITLEQYNKDLVFKATNQKGASLLVGKRTKNNTSAVQPLEMLLMSLATYSSVSIVEQLKEKHIVDFSYKVNVSTIKGTSVKIPYEKIIIHYDFEGDIPKHCLQDAVVSSYQTYGKSIEILSPKSKINHQILLNGKTL